VWRRRKRRATEISAPTLDLVVRLLDSNEGGRRPPNPPSTDRVFPVPTQAFHPPAIFFPVPSGARIASIVYHMYVHDS
jgi:hypothetical protein